MTDDPLSICNDIFQNQGKAFSMQAMEIDCHHIGKSRRDFMRHQMQAKLTPEYQVTNDSRRFRITIASPRRARA